MPTESRQVVKQLKKEKRQREVDCPLQGSRRGSSLCLIIVCFHEICKSKILNFNLLIGQQLPSLTCPLLHTFPYGVKWPWSHPRVFVLMGHRQFFICYFSCSITDAANMFYSSFCINFLQEELLPGFKSFRLHKNSRQGMHYGNMDSSYLSKWRLFYWAQDSCQVEMERRGVTSSLQWSQKSRFSCQIF